MTGDMMNTFTALVDEIKKCTICKDILTPDPILQIGENSKILIVGQAPGKKTTQEGILFDDKSGERLRKWLGFTSDQFYVTDNFSILPVAFCYPGRGKNGDNPPPKICAETYMEKLQKGLTNLQFTIIVGEYAIKYELHNPKQDLTELVQEYKTFLPSRIILPHPSPRNNIWLSKNKYFEEDIVPVLQQRVKAVLG
jgi:uracil-DNA glycosylase